LAVVRVLVLNKRAHALLAQARVRAKQAHVHFDRAREQKAERKSDDPYNRMRREGGAFALVRLRIAPSFPLGGEKHSSL